MTHHPHVHMIVPGGGISLDGSRWIACRPDFFLPVRVLSKLFRRLMLEKLAGGTRGRPAAVLRRACALADAQGVRRLPRAAQEEALVRLRQAPVRRARRRCSPICRATPTASPSRTAV